MFSRKRQKDLAPEFQEEENRLYNTGPSLKKLKSKVSEMNKRQLGLSILIAITLFFAVKSTLNANTILNLRSKLTVANFDINRKNELIKELKIKIYAKNRVNEDLQEKVSYYEKINGIKKIYEELNRLADEDLEKAKSAKKLAKENK